MPFVTELWVKLNRFLELIPCSSFQETKVVLLEDLAAHFKMKTQDTIDRVTKLSAEGLLTGWALILEGLVLMNAMSGLYY